MAIYVSLAIIILISGIAKALYQVWLRPHRIRRMMSKQGVHGPPYSLLSGNNRVVSRMKKLAGEKPINNLSHDTLHKVLPHVDAWTAAYGKSYLSWVGLEAELVITDPVQIKEVLNDKDRVFFKVPPQSFIKKILGNGLATSDGDKWAKVRKLANHAFHGDSLKSMIPDMVDSTRMMLERWEEHEGKEVEVFREYTAMTSEAISRTAFGSSYVEGRSIFEMLTRLSVLAVKNAFDTPIIPGFRKIFKTPDQEESERLDKAMRDAILQIIEKRESKAQAGDSDGFGKDFLGSLVKALHDKDDGKRITIDDLVDECKTFYIAGQETTSVLLLWTTFLLAIHPEWQEEVRREVFDVIADKDPNADSIPRLKTMSMIMNESLRLYPPVVGISRKIYRRTPLGKLVIPAGTLLSIPILALHHDRDLWGEDVHDFKPERFAEGVAKATRNNPGAFMPFSLGTRNCVGLNFALIEAKVALSMILRQYRFTLSSAYVHSPINQFVTSQPQHGVQIILEAV